MTRPRPAVLLALVLAAVLGPLTACAGAPPDPLTAVRAAVAQTYGEGTARLAFTSSTGPPGDPGTPVTGHGVADLVAGTADATVEIPLLGGGTRVLLVGGTLYAQVPPTLAALVPGGAPWVSVPLDRLTARAVGGPLALFGGTPIDPLGQIDQLRGVTEARVVGPEPVDGTPATHYAAVVDLLTTPAAGDPARRPAVDRLIEEIGTRRLPVDVWVDDRGLLRRVAQTVTAPERPGRPATATTTTVTLTEHGLPVTVTPPPADQVTDVGVLLPAG
ncbi:hypothetical protein [Actinomycetospora cinnamomea]|uniref:LppX_LprAFG lipoprotein n=1 Tax=Actinomycetospora cinnamomea TaxID=663609 RepID=A0A2U1EVF0_9PSEU|nr:hypothetical protein [Actinomycetospora cinnamomea]PVZ03906.1 hypothetical protein C8D89_11915 [Actinomycetospora cinnamomea]